MFKGYVLGWSTPTYVSPDLFIEAARHVGGYDTTSICMYHSGAFASRVNHLVRQRRDAGVFVRQIGRNHQTYEVLYSLVLEKKNPDSLETYPNVVFSLPLDLHGTALVRFVDHRFPLGQDELQRELDRIREQVPSASVLARLARRITRRGAVALRKGGGAYFIPAVRNDLLEMVELTIHALQGDLMKFAVTGQEYELRTIFESLRDQFGIMVTQLRLRAVRAKRDKTVENVQRELTEIIDTISIYKDILGSYASQLDIIFETAKRSLIESIAITPPSKIEAPSPTVLPTGTVTVATHHPALTQLSLL
jgi:hypothetical protein